MKKISLTQSKYALVDDEDFKRVNQFKWFVHSDGQNQYARRNVSDGKGGQKIIKMHRFILNDPKEPQVDHINKNGLDNQKKNLRSCNHRQNQQNQFSIRGTSRYKGVHLRKNRWIAQIKINSVLKHLGCFRLEADAALAYDRAAESNFGKFARTNEMMGLLVAEQETDDE